MKKLAYILIIIGLTMILTGIVWWLYDLHRDYICSTTTNIEWFIENDCERYIRWKD